MGVAASGGVAAAAAAVSCSCEAASSIWRSKASLQSKMESVLFESGACAGIGGAVAAPPRQKRGIVGRAANWTTFLPTFL